MPAEDLVRRLGNLTSADVAALDAGAARLGVDTAILMEHAGWQVARHAALLAGRHARITVASGSGNNGGDGVVAARILSGWGHRVKLVVAGSADRLTSEAGRRVQATRACGVSVVIDQNPQALKAAVSGCDLAVDALLGTGFHGAVRPAMLELLAALDASRVLAVDIPSGIDATDGSGDAAVTASATCTLAGCKRGLWTINGQRHAGPDIRVADIGMPEAAFAACGLEIPTDVKDGELIPVFA